MEGRDDLAPKSKNTLQRLLKRIPLNIGTFIFGLIFIYMIVSIILYITADHIESYMVTAGPLAQNQTYTALAVREEQVISTSSSGYITYYARANTKVAEDGVVYTLGSSPSSSQEDMIAQIDLSRIRSSLSSFSASYDKSEFDDTYNYKYELEGIIQQYTQVETSNQNAMSINGATIYKSPADGVISYSMDGYEDLNMDELNKNWFDKRNYQFKNLRADGKVSAGDSIYKLITNEKWSILIPVTSEQVVQLAERKTIRVKFLKDDATQVGRFTILTDHDGLFYVKITFYNGMIRYANDRFLEVELVTNLKSGLKIPLTSIVKKDFYIIPKDYVTYEEENKKAGFNMITSIDESTGESSVKFIRATLYQEDEQYYYVDTKTFEEGNILIKPNSQATYTIQETKALDGVYCINKGYAVFRQIKQIDQNDEYCIVEIGTDYGIAQFDYIVRNGVSVNEDDILYD